MATSCRSMVAAWIAILVICLASGIATTGHAASAAGDLHFKKQDLEFILKQIVISERHANGEALETILPNLSVPWGLRTIDGSFNNLIGGQTQFGAADEEFLQLVAPTYSSAQVLEKLHPACAGTASDPCTLAPNDVLGAETSYVRGDGRTTQDSTARLISNLIVNQSSDNPAAVAAAASNENSSEESVGFADTQFIIPNSAPDEGLSAPFNLFMTFFGQFFDHGLDLINKGGNGLVFMPLAPDDPLYDPSSTANFMLMPRATKDCGNDGLCGNGDDGIGHINATTPHVDQQQTYASHASAHILLRHYDFGPCPTSGGPTSPPAAGCLQSSGELLNGWGNDGVLDTPDDGGMATWDTAQAQTSTKMGITLDDFDGANIPMFAADAYGKFIPGPEFGLPQLVTGTDPLVLVEGNLTTPVDASQALRVNHSFFLDVAHTSNPGAFKGVGVDPDKAPDADSALNPRTDSLSGQPTRGIRAPGIPLPCTGAGCVGQSTYDDELLGAHFVCGDGRCNENIALTTIHTLFHSEHNRLAYVTKRVVLDSNDPAFLNEWLDTELAPTEFADLMVDWTAAKAVLTDISDASQANQAATATAIDGLDLDWNGERVFQTARFGTEMQYNRVVFDEFVPTLAGLKDPFEGFHTNVNPSITAEFSQQVYRFGHSMLNQDVWRYDADFNTIVDPGALDSTTAGDQLGLFEAFLNPLALYNYSDNLGEYTLTPEQGTGAVIRGLTRQFGNEVDEFVTGGMQNNLVGLPLDIGAINIARGRDVGTARLNKARRAFFAATQDSRLAPYVSWNDYGDNIRHEASLVNFVAAYGTHPSVAGDDGIVGNGDNGEPSTVTDRRAAACAVVSSQSLVADFCTGLGFGAAAIPTDADAFMRSVDAWAAVNDLPVTGLEDIDFWNGGLAEERFPFQGYLGSTHNFVFENQMENLQNGDRFYYVGRTSTIPLFGALESNTFASLAMRNTDLGDFGGGTLPLGIFSRPNHNLEVDQSQQFNTTTNTNADPPNEADLTPLVIRDAALVTTNITIADPAHFIQYTGGDHVIIGGTEFDDTIIGGIGDDSLWGREGNDRIEGGDGADHIEGGPGDDIITDLAGPDVIEGGAGNDAIASGNEEDVIFGDEGSDFIINASEFGEIFGGPGNDFILDGTFLGHIRGGTGDDWMENLGGGEDLFQGDTGAAPEGGEPGHKGNDVLISHAGNNDGDMENGDDILVDGPGIDRVEGQLGFDWVSFQNDKFGVSVDLDLDIFTRPVLPVSNASIQNRYDRVEGLSGSPFGDILRGTANRGGADRGNELSISTNASGQITTDGFGLIDGLNETATALPLVPMNERKVLLPDVVTGDAQHGWTNGDLIIGGGSSDLLVGEGGDDIIDGDSALDVHLSVPVDPGMATGALGTAMTAAQAAVNAATTARSNAQAAFNAAHDANGAAQAALATGLAGLSTTASDLLAAAQTAQADADTAAQLASDLSAAAVLEEVNAAALQQAADDALNFLVSWQDAMTAAMNATIAGDQAVVDAAAASADAAQAATVAAAATATAQAAANTAAAASAVASQAAIDALLALIQGSMNEAEVTALTNAATAASATNASVQADLASALTAQAAANADAAAAMTAHSQAVVDALAADANVADMNAAVVAAAAANVLAQQNATDAQTAANAARATADAAALVAATAQSDADLALVAANNAAGNVLALQEAAADAAALRAITLSNLQLRNNDLAIAAAAKTEADAAMAAATAGTGPFLVAGMRDLQEAVFAGAINPGVISISRVINDHDPSNQDTDVVYFAGNFEDYCIESDPGLNGIFCDDDDPLNNVILPLPGGEGVIGTGIGDRFSRDPITGVIREGDLDGFIEVLDTRPLPTNLTIEKNGNDGRDLLRNIERLVFQDVVILLPEFAAGAADPNLNSAAVGLAAITTTPATPPDVFDILSASLDMVTDADNCLIFGMGCGIDGTVAYYWQIEEEPGTGYFTNIRRLDGIAGNGDVTEATGSTMQLTADEAGLNVRVLTIFKDDAGVFETVKSASYLTTLPPGFPVPPGLLGLIPATFLGTAADIAAAIAAQDFVLTPLLENASRIGGPRLDLTVAEVPLALFENTGFGAELIGTDEVLVAGMLLTFTDSEGNVLGTFTPEITAIVDLLTGEVDQGNVDISFSIRGADVTPLVVPPFSIATFTVNGIAVANATLLGDSSVDSATGVATVLINQSPLLVAAGTPLANFTGGAADLEPLSFGTGATLEVNGFTIHVPGVAANLFSQVPAANGPGIPVADGITLEFKRLIPVAPATEAAITGLFRPEIVSGSSPNTVDVLWFMDDVEVEPLVDGLARMSVRVGGIPGDVSEAVTLFGDSGADAGIDVMLLSTLAQQQAAAALVIAEAEGNPGHIEDATAALLAANLAALGDNAPGAAAAQLALDPHANFVGDEADLSLPIFENVGRDGLARFDFTIPDVPLALFENTGFGPTILVGDEILSDRISLMFSRTMNQVTGLILPEAVAIQNPISLDVSQTHLDVYWSIRGVDVEPLVVGATTVSVLLDGDPVPGATMTLSGDSRFGDAASVVQITGLATTQAAGALASALVMGDPVAASVARVDLAAAIAAIPPAPPVPFICHLHTNDPNVAQGDADADGTGDPCDNCRFAANGLSVGDLGGNMQRDTDADGFGNVCDPDLDNNGVVNFGDFVRFQAGWGTTNPNLDFNGDGVVNFGDLSILSNYMFGVPGENPAP